MEMVQDRSMEYSQKYLSSLLKPLSIFIFCQLFVKQLFVYFNNSLGNLITEKVTISMKNFFSKCYQIRRKLRI